MHRLWQEVIAGRRDYMSQGAWLLSVEALPPGTRLVLWLDTTANPNAGIVAQVSSPQHVERQSVRLFAWLACRYRSCSLSHMWYVYIQVVAQAPEVQLQWAAMLSSGQLLPAQHDVLLSFRPSWWLMATAFMISAQPAASSTASSSSQAYCWAPLFEVEHRTAGGSSAPTHWAAAPGLPLWHASLKEESRISLISDPGCELVLR
jgi:hypothetical protein